MGLGKGVSFEEDASKLLRFNLICNWTVIACSFLQTLWLSQAGGGWVIFAAIVCLISSLFAVISFGCDLRDKLPIWWPQAELFLSVMSVVFTTISVAVAVVAIPQLYVAEEDGIFALYDSRPITAVVVFLVGALVFYVAELIFVVYTRLHK